MLEKNENLTGTTFDLRFDIVMISEQLSSNLANKFFKVFELLLTLLQFSHTKQW